MAALTPSQIEVVGADANNLRDVDVSFPLGGISMVVGVSGSGKSSLLKNVLAAEGNQRLKDFLHVSQDHLAAPLSHAYVGPLPATVHVGQGSFRASSRTTVATASGLLSLLRQMFVRWSEPISPTTGETVRPPDAQIYSQWLFEHHRGQIVIWAIPLSFVADDGVDMAKRLAQLGLNRAIVRSETDSPTQWEKGREVLLNNFPPLSTRSRHLVEVPIGTFSLAKLTAKTEADVTSLLELAFNVGEGRVFVETPKSTLADLHGTHGIGLDSRHHWVTAGDSRVYRPANPHLLSFNAPEHESSGACSVCRGLGKSASVDIETLFSRPLKSMHEGACALWTTENYKYINIQHCSIEGLRGIAGFDPDRPWSHLSTEARHLVLYGSGDQLVTDIDPHTGRPMSKPRLYPGLIPAIMKHVSKGTKTAERLAFLIRDGHCETCQGSRWSHAVRALRLGGQTIGGLLAANFDQLAMLCEPTSAFAQSLPEASHFLAQLARLSRSLVGVGLAHLNGARGMRDISEGESRRIRLAAVFDGHKQGICLLLDEPARGLHDEDVLRLTQTLMQLRGQHTLIINEHRQRLALAADHFVALGPNGGPRGGQVTHAGPVPKEWWDVPAQLKRERLAVHDTTPHLHIRGACRHNLGNQDISLPLGHLICVTGLSGSGKSSFVHGVLKPALADPTHVDPQGWRELEGSQHVSQVLCLDQGNPPVNRRSIVATFLELAKHLRDHYATLTDAVKLKLQARDFGLNSGDGRCRQCLGIGETQDLQQWVLCPNCGGLRFRTQLLDIYDHGLNIAELLDRSIQDLLCDLPPALLAHEALLQSIERLGLGHLSLGRRLDTLSGGEIQRLRIARQLNLRNPHGFILLMDEPASGLHKNDVANLLRAIDHILAHGQNTVVLVEHNLSIVAASDWVIEFGPGSGPHGGIVVAKGTPEDIAQTDTATGRMLRSFQDLQIQPALSPVNPPKASCSDSTTAAGTLRWLRRLLGHDIAPAPSGEAHTPSTPTVVFTPRDYHAQRLLEYGGLDRELLSFALEQQTLACHEYSPHHFLATWAHHPKAQLVVHPFLQDIYIWGKSLPDSLVKERLAHLKSQGYQLLEEKSHLQARITKRSFQCSVEATAKQRQDCLANALAIGAGYVELCDDKQQCLARYATRLVALPLGLVGPLAMSVFDFMLSGQRGKCPSCKGSGNVLGYDTSLVFANTKAGIEDKAIFSSPALAILKGVHRNILTPFFRRMTKEGLWPTDHPYQAWTQSQQDVILHGFWPRPGPGSFLKSAKDSPDEVASWLRWDGLWLHLRENLERADVSWRRDLLASSEARPCPTCGGLGLQAYVHLLQIGDRDYPTWIRHGTVKDLHQLLIKDQPVPRLQKRSQRLSQIMAELVNKGFGEARLFQQAQFPVYESLVPSTVNAFTHMPLLMEEVP